MPPKVHRANGSARDKPARLCILAFSLGFTAYLSNAVVSANRPFIFQRRVVLKPLVSLIGRLVACCARISVYSTGKQSRGPRKRAHARLRIVILWRVAVNCVIKTAPGRETARAYIPTYRHSCAKISMPIIDGGASVVVSERAGLVGQLESHSRPTIQAKRA